MEPDKSTGSGLSVAEADVVTTAASSKRSKPTGKRSTGKERKQTKVSQEAALMIAQSSLSLLAQHFGKIQVSNGDGLGIYLRLPAAVHVCTQTGCLTLFAAPIPDSLFCAVHRTASTELPVPDPEGPATHGELA